MKLFYSPLSPYARKVTVVAHETGLEPRIERITVTVSPLKSAGDFATHNPLGKVPTLVTDDGLDLFDSPVICEYLDSLHDGRPLVPRMGPARWRALRLEALADGLLDAAILCRYESTMRPEDKRFPDWVAGQAAKANLALDAAEREPLGAPDGPTHIGEITLACALGWLELRRPFGPIRAGRPKLFAWYDRFALRPSMQATVPRE